MCSSAPLGTHPQFVHYFEAYFLAACPPAASGRRGLAGQIASEIEDRQTKRLLDCAAGTGFPVLDLVQRADDLSLETVHACDGDPTMIAELARQAEIRDVDLASLAPLPDSVAGSADSDRAGSHDLVINWRGLDRIHGTYDYVLCRGNSLAYADTWSGGDRASSRAAIREHLARIAGKVERGGYLHVDAPWKLTPAKGPVDVIRTPSLTITEQIIDHQAEGDDDGHREWLVHFIKGDDESNRDEIRFRRLSSRLTIHDVADELQKLGQFDEIEPFQMKAERVVYGTIIARKVR